MQLEYVPLLEKAREFYLLPRNLDRFQAYLRIIADDARENLKLVPFVAMNPMAKDHVRSHLETYLALGAEEIAAEAVREMEPLLEEMPGRFHVGMVIPDDVAGGWTNRYATEHGYRCPAEVRCQTYDWITVYLWAGDEPTERGVREAVKSCLFRCLYLHRHGFAKTLREKLAQEGWVMANAGCDAPALDVEDLEYSRYVIEPFLDTTDMRTAIECMFGDAAGKTLGFTPRGLSPYAGLALALHDAKSTWINVHQPACAGADTA